MGRKRALSQKYQNLVDTLQYDVRSITEGLLDIRSETDSPLIFAGDISTRIILAKLTKRKLRDMIDITIPK
jgi:hypothetical protein